MNTIKAAEEVTSQLPTQENVLFEISNLTQYNKSVLENSWKRLNLESFRTAYFVIFAILTLVTNLVTIAVIRKYKSLKSTVSVYIMSLCWADLIGFPTLILGQFLHHIKDDNAYKYLFLVTQVLQAMSLGLSLLSHFITACDRYIAVLHPLRYQSPGVAARKKRAITRVLGIWFYCSILIIPAVSFHVSKLDTIVLRQRPRIVLLLPPWVRITIFDAQVITFLLITLFLYIRIIYKLRKKSIISSSVSVSTTTNQKTRSITNMMAVTLVTMVTCWLPWNIWSSLSNKDNLNESLKARFSHEFTLILLYANSFVNPFIYAKMNTDFRKAYKKLLRLQWGRSSTNNQVVPPNNEPNRSPQTVFHISN